MKISHGCEAATLLLAGVLVASMSLAQDAVPQDEVAQADPGAIEETVVLGRLQSAAQSLLQDRIEDESVVDVLDADAISRMGDSTVAASLRRVSGLTLVNDKFVYIRGLGERYSSTTLNGAFIPSPDLTRNVVPLDLFPSAIVSSLQVQKSFSADVSANFAGGLVDIATNPFPDKGLNFTLEGGSGFNTEADNLITYAGGGDDDWGTDDGTRAIPSAILTGLDAYLGSITVGNIQATDGSTTAAAQAVNNGYALALNRNITVQSEDDSPDLNGRISLGNSVDLSDNLEGGFQVSGAYDSVWRATERRTAKWTDAANLYEAERETTRSVNTTATGTLGFRYIDEHTLTFATIFLRNTDDETAILDRQNENRILSDGLGFRDYRLEFEEREMNIHQVKGEHSLGLNTKELAGGLLDWVPDESSLDWFYSESVANSDIPNRVVASFQTSVDPLTAAILSEQLIRDTSAVSFRFTELEDEVTSYGWKGLIPFSQSRYTVDLSFGFQHDQKVRTYAQREFGLGAIDAPTATLQLPLDQLLTDSSITNQENDWRVQQVGQGARSYIAATMTDAGYGQLDWTLDETWRVVAGLRHEEYRQVALPWNVYAYYNGTTRPTETPISMDTEVLGDAAFADESLFPAVSMMYMSDWLAETFQLRFNYSETAIRPDLREVTDASYIDPITGELVNGNPDVVPSSVDNYDVRAEWFFSNGNNLTVSLFMKDIENPIEYFETAASDTSTARSIINAAETSITGVEVDGLISLGVLGGWGESFFVQGNATFQDSETTAGPAADNPTSDTRPATGASDYVVNLMLGYDSMDGKHAATILYNVFGERLYVAGRAGAPDGYEQPFNSLDVTYSWYPTENWTVKLKAQNLLDEAIEVERSGVVTFSEKPGMAMALKVKYDF